MSCELSTLEGGREEQDQQYKSMIQYNSESYVQQSYRMVWIGALQCHHACCAMHARPLLRLREDPQRVSRRMYQYPRRFMRLIANTHSKLDA